MSGAAMTARPLAAADREGWQAPYAGCQRFYDRDPDAAFYDAAFARLMSGNPQDFQGLVAEQDDRLLGLTHYVFHPNLWRAEGLCDLQDLLTAPQGARQGRGPGADSGGLRCRRCGRCSSGLLADGRE